MRKRVTDSDNPELTRADFARMQPFPGDLPAPMVKAIVGTHAAAKRKRGQRGPQKSPTKALVSIRISREALERWRASGPGWQTRLAVGIEAFAPAAPQPDDAALDFSDLPEATPAQLRAARAQRRRRLATATATDGRKATRR